MGSDERKKLRYYSLPFIYVPTSRPSECSHCAVSDKDIMLRTHFMSKEMGYTI